MPKTTSRLFSWLNQWRDDELHGRIEAIYIAAAGGAPMRAVAQCRCLAGLGLAGDRYASGTGHWIGTDGCAVTLVTAEDMARAARRSGLPFAEGAHRRNLVVSGIPLAAFRRRQVQVGAVRFAFHRLRPPCAYLDRLLQPGAGKALGKGAGIGLQVLDDGIIRVGDPVRVLTDPAAQSQPNDASA